MPPSDKYSMPGGNTEVRSEVKTSSRPPQSYDFLKQNTQSPQAQNIHKSQDKKKFKSPICLPHFDEHYPMRRTSDKPNLRTKTLKKAEDKDELVKHMSNLPGYLQRVEKGENFQGKALNFGVLDWNQLEKWKYSDSGLPSGSGDVSSSSGSKRVIEKRLPPSHSSRSYPPNQKSFSKYADPSRMKVIEKEYETSLRNTPDQHKSPHLINIPSSKSNSGIKSERGMKREIDRIAVSEKETSLSRLRKFEIPHSRKDVTKINSQKTNSQDVHDSKPVLPFEGKSKEAYDETRLDKVSSEEVRFESLLRSNSSGYSQNLELLNVGSCSSETQTGPSQPKCIDTRTPISKPLGGNRVDSPRSSDYESFESATVKGTIASPSRRFSFGFGKISRSLSFKENSAVLETSTTPRRLSSDEVSSSAELYPVHSCPLPTGRTLTSVNIAPEKQSTEFDAVQDRYSSPTRRFGLSLGKMKRSLSFKDILNTPQLGTLNINKDSLQSKSRSSPLRRLLEPVLKTRVTCPSPTETSPYLTQNPNQVSRKEYLDKTKSQDTIVQALLQVTIKNGLPLFKLVVNNGSDILVAMKNITPPGKRGVASIYTFYSVHEIKKKSSWFSQVNKEKSYGFSYNVIGQMKTSANNFKEDEFVEKEFVLYSVDRKQGDGEAPELVPIRELASIIVRVPHGKSNDDVDERNIGRELTGKEFSEYLEEEKYLFGKGEAEKFNSTIVILSGADHGLPNNGAPSSLIQRWRSGGSCDCGGWDVGCKLRILANEDQSYSFPEQSVSSSNRDGFNLFIQGEARHSKPIFRLAPFKKGIYSIEFSSSISLSQALSTCIAALTSQIDFSELNFSSEGKLAEESTFSRYSETQNPSKAQELPGKNVPSPPSSPVGRV